MQLIQVKDVNDCAILPTIHLAKKCIQCMQETYYPQYIIGTQICDQHHSSSHMQFFGSKHMTLSLIRCWQQMQCLVGFGSKSVNYKHTKFQIHQNIIYYQVGIRNENRFQLSRFSQMGVDIKPSTLNLNIQPINLALTAYPTCPLHNVQ